MLSSHLVADLERVCDYLVVLTAARVQLAGEVEELLAAHHRLTGPRRDPAALPGAAGGDLGQPHRPADHAAGPHRRPDPRPGLDRRAGRPGRPGPGLHGPGRHRRAAAVPYWRYSDDLAHLAPVPHPGLGGPAPPWPCSRSSSRSPARTWPACTTPAGSPPARPTATAGRWSPAFMAELTGHDVVLYLLGVAVLYVVPALIGIFWGAPLVARELETGTFRLAWNQSVTRTRWLAVKLGLIGLASMAAAGLFSLMVTWWSSPIDQANGLDASRNGSRASTGSRRCCSARAASSRSATPRSPSPSASPPGCSSAAPCRPWPSPSPSSPSVQVVMPNVDPAAPDRAGAPDVTVALTSAAHRRADLSDRTVT